MGEYVSNAVITSIKATSRASVKVRDSYFTVEYTEERIIPDLPDVDIDAERACLWDTVNAERDNQVEDILKNYS